MPEKQSRSENLNQTSREIPHPGDLSESGSGESFRIIKKTMNAGNSDTAAQHLPRLSITNESKIQHRFSDQPDPINLDLEDTTKLREQIKSLSLNQCRDVLKAIREGQQTRGYNPQQRVLGHGTEVYNSDNPFVNPDTLYRPNGQSIDVLALRRQHLQKESTKQPSLSPFDTETQKAPQDLFGLSRLKPAASDQARQELKATRDIALSNASPEQKRQYDQLQAIERADRNDPYKRGSLQDRLKAPLEQLTPQQLKTYADQLELQQILQADDVLSHHIDQLQALYDRNHWREDSKWYGIDDNKFLVDIRSGDLSTVSNYDKFRALAVIDDIKKNNPDIFGRQLFDFQVEKRAIRKELVDQENNIKFQLMQQLREEIAKIGGALSNQQNSQGAVSNSADWVIGHAGTSGGWGGAFMDSDATSQAVRENLEIARKATARLDYMADLYNYTEFTEKYKETATILSQSLERANENLTKMAEAHQGRVEGVSDIVQFAAAVAAISACAAAAPETFGGSLAAIPVVAPMAAGAAAKVTTKLLDSGTSQTGNSYRLSDALTDGSIAAITSATFLPGGKLAKPLMQAESTVVKQAVANGGKQLVAETTFLGVAKTVGKRAAGYSLAGALDGATVGATRAVIKQDEDPIVAIREGTTGGAILGPVLGPIIKYAGPILARGIGRLKTNIVADNAKLKDTIANYLARKRPPEIKAPAAASDPVIQAGRIRVEPPEFSGEHVPSQAPDADSLNVQDYRHQVGAFKATYDWLKTAKVTQSQLAREIEQLEAQVGTKKERLHGLREQIKATEDNLQTHVEKLTTREQELIRQAYEDPVLRKPNDPNVVDDLEKVEGLVLYSPENPPVHLPPDPAYNQVINELQTNLTASRARVRELEWHISDLRHGGEIGRMNREIDYQKALKTSEEPERLKRNCDKNIAKLERQLERETKKVEQSVQELMNQLQDLINQRNKIKDMARKLFESKLAAMKPGEVASIPGNAHYGEWTEVFELGKPYKPERTIYITVTGSANKRVYSLVNPLDPPTFRAAGDATAGRTSVNHLFVGRTNPVSKTTQYSRPRRGEQVVLKPGDEVQIGGELNDPLNRRFIVP